MNMKQFTIGNVSRFILKALQIIETASELRLLRLIQSLHETELPISRPRSLKRIRSPG